jgi:ribosomal protein L11 methylase PrmA
VVSPDLVLAFVLYAFAAFLVYLFLSGLVWGAGWAPTSRRQLQAAAKLLQLKEGETVYDLGSGFGRAVIFFAREYRVSAVGVEIDPVRKLVTTWSARRQGVSAEVAVMRRNLLEVDLKGATKVFFFLTPLLMRRLQEKLAREMPPGALVVSVDHRFPDWEPVESIENVHLYVVGRSNAAEGSTPPASATL